VEALLAALVQVSRDHRAVLDRAEEGVLAPQPDPVQAPGDEFPASDDPKHRGEQELAV